MTKAVRCRQSHGGGLQADVEGGQDSNLAIANCLFPQDSADVFGLVYKAEDEGIYGLAAVVAQYKITAVGNAHRSEVVPIPIFLIDHIDGFIPEACR